MVNKAIDFDQRIWSLLPLHYTILIWGFFIQLIMGTAYWMFPKFLSNRPRGSSWQTWFVFYNYNLGLVLYLITKFMIPINPLTLLGKFLIFLGLVTFIKLTWTRVISYT